MSLICLLLGHRPHKPDEYHLMRCRRCNKIQASGTWHEELK